MGEVTAIWIKRFERGPMDPVAEAELVAGAGLVGCSDQGGIRQITIIEESAWRAALDELGIAVDPSARRANVMVRDLDLEESRDKVIRLGGCSVRILGETRPCHRMDEAQQGLRQALAPHWRAGAYGEILEGGTLRVGDQARFEVGRASSPEIEPPSSGASA